MSYTILTKERNHLKENRCKRLYQTIKSSVCIGQNQASKASTVVNVIANLNIVATATEAFVNITIHKLILKLMWESIQDNIKKYVFFFCSSSSITQVCLFLWTKAPQKWSSYNPGTGLKIVNWCSVNINPQKTSITLCDSRLKKPWSTWQNLQVPFLEWCPVC